MGEAVRKFVPRAPRYVLRPQDRSTMRFSLENTYGSGGIEHTLLLNLSESGLAFLLNRGHEPHLGEVIKVEVPIPGGEQIAWWGRVVRVSEFEPHGWGFYHDRFKQDPKVLVALKFVDLPDQHSRAIRKGIRASLMQAMRDQQYRNWVYYKSNVLENFWKYFAYAALTAFVVWFIYFFTQPDANYDSKRGTQWGDRFKF